MYSALNQCWLLNRRVNGNISAIILYIMSYRLEIVYKLITFSEPLSALSVKLNRFNWDYDGFSITLDSHHIITLLKRFINGDLAKTEIEHWANLIECREDIISEELNRTKMEEIIFIMANSENNGELNIEMAQSFIDSLSIPK
jgi:hypothetical protein